MTVAVLRDILQTLNEAYRRSPYELRRAITGVALTIIRVDNIALTRETASRSGEKRVDVRSRTHTQRPLNSDTQSLRQRNSLDISDCQSGEESSCLLPTSRRKRSPARHADCSYNKVLTHQSPVHSIICNYYVGIGDQ